MERFTQLEASYLPTTRFTSGPRKGLAAALVFYAVLSCVFTPIAVGQEQAESSGAKDAAAATGQGDAFDKALATPATEVPADDYVADEDLQPPPPYPDPPKNAKRLSKVDRAWIDRDGGFLIVDARVTLRRGLLEMFACPPNTKEHESVVAVDSHAFILHAALLTLGAESGTPVEFTPEYKPPTGTTIDIDVEWRDAADKLQRTKAQEWIRDARTKKPMALRWVFAGSEFWHDPETGQRGYQAEAGDLVCVANFGTAMLDVPAEATSDNAGLLFEANSDLIPPLGTPVRLYFKPALDDQEPKQADDAKPAKSEANEPLKPSSDAPPRQSLRRGRFQLDVF